MIDVNAYFNSENLIPDHAEVTEEEQLLESNNNVSINIPTVFQFNKAIDNEKVVVCKNKRQRTDTVDLKNNDATYIYSNPLQGYHLDASFLSRVWQTLHHLHSGLILYKSIFLRALSQKRYLPQ